MSADTRPDQTLIIATRILNRRPYITFNFRKEGKVVSVFAAGERQVEVHVVDFSDFRPAYKERWRAIAVAAREEDGRMIIQAVLKPTQVSASAIEKLVTSKTQEPELKPERQRLQTGRFLDEERIARWGTHLAENNGPARILHLRPEDRMAPPPQGQEVSGVRKPPASSNAPKKKAKK